MLAVVISIIHSETSTELPLSYCLLLPSNAMTQWKAATAPCSWSLAPTEVGLGLQRLTWSHKRMWGIGGSGNDLDMIFNTWCSLVG